MTGSLQTSTPSIGSRYNAGQALVWHSHVHRLDQIIDRHSTTCVRTKIRTERHRLSRCTLPKKCTKQSYFKLARSTKIQLGK